MNVKIKFRESLRPFAPAVLREDVSDYLEVRPGEDSPYMLLVALVRREKRLKVEENGARGIEKLRQPRSVVPAVTHVDYSARFQTPNEPPLEALPDECDELGNEPRAPLAARSLETALVRHCQPPPPGRPDDEEIVRSFSLPRRLDVPNRLRPRARPLLCSREGFSGERVNLPG
jgi:hypothetical protein